MNEMVHFDQDNSLTKGVAFLQNDMVIHHLRPKVLRDDLQ